MNATEAERFRPEAERAFVRQVLDKHPPAVDRLIDRLACIPRFLLALNARGGRPLDSQSVDDLAQDTALLVLNRLGSFRGDAPLESWVHSICRHHFLSELRRRQRWRPASLDSDHPVAVDEAFLEGLADHEHVEVALAEVGGVEADVIRLRDLEGRTFQEIADRSGVALSTIKTRYYRGFTRLRELVQMREGRFVGKAAS